MKLSDLCEDICALPARGEALVVSGLTADSRAVEPGFLFAALKGARADGARFIPDAVAAGAKAILGDHLPEFDPGGDVACLVCDEPRRALALMAARFYDVQPATMVAVTGTAGKTSVATFARQIFAHAGHLAASIGTVGVSLGDETRYGNLTTPDPVTLHRILKELADDNVTHCAMEASSHGLDQHRLDGVRLKAAGFTNLGRDHLDYHATMEEYLAAKLHLFDRVLTQGGVAVVNADCAEAEMVAKVAKAAGQTVFTVGRRGQDLKVAGLERAGARQIVDLEGAGGSRRIVLPLAGAFQVSNALVAAGLAIAAGVPEEKAIDALECLKGAPGRLDLVAQSPAGADIFVDYAHKPDALETALASLRPFTKGQLIVVFGAGGDRDRGKRPLMGAIAQTAADLAIVTDDNPRTEDPGQVRRAILQAVPEGMEIADRREAIAEAIRIAGPGDVVLVAGKGHEPGQIVGTRTLPFSDYDVVRELTSKGAPL